MANNEELGKLSTEQLQKLANTISEAKNLTSQQEEIIKKVLAGEVEVGNLRIAYLNQYFDQYSKRLDQIVARKTSTLNDTFLVIDKKLGEEFKALSSNISEFSNTVSKSTTSNDTKSKSGKQTDSPDSFGINQYINSSTNSAKKGFKTLEDLRTVYLDKLVALEKRNAESRLSLEFARSKQEEDLWLRSTEFQLSKIKEVAAAELNVQQKINDTDTQLDYTSTKKGQKEIGRMRADVVNAKAELEAREAIEKEIIAIRDRLEDEARAKHKGKLLKKDAAEIEAQVNTEYTNRLKKLKQLTEERFKSEAQLRALSDLKRDDPAVAAAFDKERAERKRQLELEARRHNNNILTQEDNKNIEAQLKKEFDTRTEYGTKLLEELGRRELANAELANIKANDPELGAKLEAKVKQEIIDLEYQYRQEHNDELTEQAIKDIEYLAKQKAMLEKDALAKKLVEEQKIAKLTEINPLVKSKLDEKRAYLMAQAELRYRLANNNQYTKEQQEADKKRIDEQLKLSSEMEDELNKHRTKALKEQQKQALQASRNEMHNAVDLSANDMSLTERFAALKDMASGMKAVDEDGNETELSSIKAGLATTALAMADLAKQLESKVDAIASYKGFIDTRLQGSNNKTVLGSYWDQLAKDMISVGAVTPYFKQEDFANNIKSLVDRGISFDLKQRAFLMTIQEKIANTFDVADGTLLRLIRIQQEDSTAGRLGMESALNSFLNNMYETSEYLSDVAASVRGSLEEMEALMGGAEATAVEYQVQKWMGSLYSVGMSKEAVSSITTALGQIAAGQVEALTSGNGAGNLMVMAANKAGIPISDILASGLDASETNKLLQATVNYLADIAESSKDNNVVQQQLANVFGVKASDLKAATNLSTGNTLSDVYGEQLTYDNMLRQLYKMTGSMNLRTSLGEQMNNVWDNVQYTLAGSMASSPIAYLTYKMASLLESTTGGIDIGLPLVFGNGLPVQFKVSDLLRAGSMAGGILGSLGSLINGLASSFSGHMMLASMGINSGSGLTVTPRGTGGSAIEALAGGGAQTLSGSGYVGNASGSDIKKSTIQQNEDEAEKQVIEAKEEAGATQIDFINTNVLKIYELLDDVASGKRSLNVKVAGYGLTNLGSNTSLSGAQGGVASLLSNNAANNSFGTGESLNSNFSSNSGASSGTGVPSNSGNDSFGASSGINLGGWTVV